MGLKAENSFLLIVDVQRRLAPATYDPEAAIKSCATLMRAARALNVPMLVSEQYPKGLGPTVDALAALAPNDATMDKVHFSCLADEAIRARIAGLERRQAVLAGMEAHVCVLQTALDLIEAGYAAAIVADAVTSRTPENKALGLARAAHRGAEIVSTEMVLFEWLRTAQHPAFKLVSASIK
jgi:nicotinamidase-related amidase